MPSEAAACFSLSKIRCRPESSALDDLAAQTVAAVIIDSFRDGVRHENDVNRSEEHTSELQSPCNLVCRLLLEKKKKITRALLHNPHVVWLIANPARCGLDDDRKLHCGLALATQLVAHQLAPP